MKNKDHSEKKKNMSFYESATARDIILPCDLTLNYHWFTLEMCDKQSKMPCTMRDGSLLTIIKQRDMDPDAEFAFTNIDQEYNYVDPQRSGIITGAALNRQGVVKVCLGDYSASDTLGITLLNGQLLQDDIVCHLEVNIRCACQCKPDESIDSEEMPDFGINKRLYFDLPAVNFDLDNIAATVQADSCIVCEENSVSVICVPCGHAHVCLPCLHKMSAKDRQQCVTCRQLVSSVIRIRKR